jgi:chaperonin GroEL
LKLKIEDAVNATKAAISEGIVVGGGSALLRAAQSVDARLKMQDGKQEGKNAKKISKQSEEFLVGYNIVLKACEEPLRQIAVNCGKGDGSIVVEAVKASKDNAGYDALKDTMVPDMFVAGIIDPVKVTRTSLQNAASAGAILLTTEVAITEEPKEEKAPAGGGMDY